MILKLVNIYQIKVVKKLLNNKMKIKITWRNLNEIHFILVICLEIHYPPLEWKENMKIKTKIIINRIKAMLTKIEIWVKKFKMQVNKYNHIYIEKAIRNMSLHIACKYNKILNKYN